MIPLGGRRAWYDTLSVTGGSVAKANTWETGLLALLFNNTAFSLVGDATGLPATGTAGSLYVSLHTSDPGEAGDQTTNETTYTSYARVAVARTSGAWTVTNGTVENVAAVVFPTCTAGSPQTVTHFGIGTSPTGAGKLLYHAAIGGTAPSIGPGSTPTFAAGALDGAET